MFFNKDKTVYYQCITGNSLIELYRKELVEFYQESYEKFSILDQQIKSNCSVQINQLLDNFTAFFCAREFKPAGKIIGVSCYRIFMEHHNYKNFKETISLFHPSIQLLKHLEARKKYHKLREKLNLSALVYFENNSININSIARCGPLFVRESYRNLGVGKKLVFLLFEEAIKNGYQYILEQPASFLCEKILLKKGIFQIGREKVSLSKQHSVNHKYISNFFIRMNEYL